MSQIDLVTISAIVFAIIMTIIVIVAIRKYPSKHYSILS